MQARERIYGPLEHCTYCGQPRGTWCFDVGNSNGRPLLDENGEPLTDAEDGSFQCYGCWIEYNYGSDEPVQGPMVVTPLDLNRKGQQN